MYHVLFQPFTDVNWSFFGFLNQGPLTLSFFLHGLIVLPMFFIYFQEKKRLQKEHKFEDE